MCTSCALTTEINTSGSLSFQRGTAQGQRTSEGKGRATDAEPSAWKVWLEAAQSQQIRSHTGPASSHSGSTATSQLVATHFSLCTHRHMFGEFSCSKEEARKEVCRPPCGDSKVCTSFARDHANRTAKFCIGKIAPDKLQAHGQRQDHSCSIDLVFHPLSLEFISHLD